MAMEEVKQGEAWRERRQLPGRRWINMGAHSEKVNSSAWLWEPVYRLASYRCQDLI